MELFWLPIVIITEQNMLENVGVIKTSPRTASSQSDFCQKVSGICVTEYHTTKNCSLSVSLKQCCGFNET